MNSSFAMFPGSFDPPTNGHIDIIERAASLYKKLFVVIAENKSKHCMFSVEERKDMLERSLSHLKNVEVAIWNGLTVDFAVKNNIGVIIRGVRALTDFSFEFELAQTNKQLCPDIEVLFMPANPKYFLVRSSTVREIVSFGADVKSMVPEVVEKAIKEKTSKSLKC